MTAKEALREIVDEMSEEQAARWLWAVDSESTDALFSEVSRLTAQELMQLPAPLRAAILRIAARLYTDEDAKVDMNAWNEWEDGTGNDVQLIDG